jgi:ferredoxin--NADP+ reductase
MVPVTSEKVLAVDHWTDQLFSFRTTRDPALRFESGQFVMVGLDVSGRPLMRAYSIASPNYEAHLDFLSVKVEDGPLTSRLQHIRPGDPVLVSRKPTGSLVLRDLHPGRNLYLFSTGTGVAPFLSISADPEAYERFERVVLVHGVRWIAELGYDQRYVLQLRSNEHLGSHVQARLDYYPAVTREDFPHRGRISELITSGTLFHDLHLPELDAARDRAMICGGCTALADMSALLNARGFRVSPHIGVPGDYVLERAFVER